MGDFCNFHSTRFYESNKSNKRKRETKFVSYIYIINYHNDLIIKYTTVPLKFQMDKKFIHTNSNELKMRESFLPFFNCYLMFHFKSVYFK